MSPISDDLASTADRTSNYHDSRLASSLHTLTHETPANAYADP